MSDGRGTAAAAAADIDMSTAAHGCKWTDDRRVTALLITVYRTQAETILVSDMTCITASMQERNTALTAIDHTATSAETNSTVAQVTQVTWWW